MTFVTFDYTGCLRCIYICTNIYIYICMCVFWSNPILSRRNQHLWIYVNSGIAGQISLSSKINHGQSPLHHKISVFPDHNWLYSIPIISLVHPHVRRWNPQVKSHWIPYVPIMPPIFSTCFLICFHYSPHILSIYVPCKYMFPSFPPHFPPLSRAHLLLACVSCGPAGRGGGAADWAAADWAACSAFRAWRQFLGALDDNLMLTLD